MSPLIGSAIYTSNILEKYGKYKREKDTHSNLLHLLTLLPPHQENMIYTRHFHLGKGKIGKGINQLADWIEKHSQIKNRWLYWSLLG